MIVAWLGPWQFAIIVLVLLFFFGGRKFGGMLRSLKRGGDEFKQAITEGDRQDDARKDDAQRKDEQPRMKIG